jgi:long-chain fatty acid transport protein
MKDFTVGGKLGLMYKPTSSLTLGVAFNNKVDIDLEGKMQLNFDALGLGKVTYRNAEAKNIDQPREFGIGAAYQATDRLLLSLELDWINWSDAVTSGIVTAHNPDNAAAPPSIYNEIENGWRDQYVIAVGTAYRLSDKTLIWAGYNYGRNPIPSKNLNPLINSIAVHHLTLGSGHRMHKSWHIDGALEWDMRNEETYTNPSLPFGKNAKTVGELVALHIRITRIW